MNQYWKKGIALTLAFLLIFILPKKAAAAIALVAGQTASVNDAAGPTATIALTNNPTAGNFVVCGVDADNGTVTSVVDGNSNAYVKTTNSPAFKNPANSYIWYLANAPANANKTLTITYTTGTLQAFCAEFSGALIASPLEADAVHTSATSQTNINDPSITTTNNGDLMIGVALAAASITTANSPWTGIGTVQNGNYAEYYIQPTAGAQAIAFTQSPGAQWTAIEAAFKATPNTTQSAPQRLTIASEYQMVIPQETKLIFNP